MIVFIGGCVKDANILDYSGVITEVNTRAQQYQPRFDTLSLDSNIIHAPKINMLNIMVDDFKSLNRYSNVVLELIRLKNSGYEFDFNSTILYTTSTIDQYIISVPILLNGEVKSILYYKKFDITKTFSVISIYNAMDFVHLNGQDAVLNNKWLIPINSLNIFYILDNGINHPTFQLWLQDNSLRRDKNTTGRSEIKWVKVPGPGSIHRDGIWVVFAATTIEYGISVGCEGGATPVDTGWNGPDGSSGGGGSSNNNNNNNNNNNDTDDILNSVLPDLDSNCKNLLDEAAKHMILSLIESNRGECEDGYTNEVITTAFNDACIKYGNDSNSNYNLGGGKDRFGLGDVLEQLSYSNSTLASIYESIGANATFDQNAPTLSINYRRLCPNFFDVTQSTNQNEAHIRVAGISGLQLIFTTATGQIPVAFDNLFIEMNPGPCNLSESVYQQILANGTNNAIAIAQQRVQNGQQIQSNTTNPNTMQFSSLLEDEIDKATALLGCPGFHTNTNLSNVMSDIHSTNWDRYCGANFVKFDNTNLNLLCP